MCVCVGGGGGGGYAVILKVAYCVFVGNEREREVWRERRGKDGYTVEGNLYCVFLHLAVLEKAGSG